MNKKYLQEIIEGLGLDEYGAKIYLAGLGLGPATVLQISRAAQIKRTTVYSVIDGLCKQGFMRVDIYGIKRKFVAEDPEKLLVLLDVRRQQFNSILPELTAMHSLTGGESFIKYYQGLEAIKAVYEDLLYGVQPHEDYLIISDQHRWVGWDEKYFRDFTERRAKLPINIRMLQVDTETSRWFKKYEKNFNYRIKFLPRGTELVTNLVVIPRRVVIHQLTPPISAIVIENKSVIQMHKEMFEIMWSALPED